MIKKMHHTGSALITLLAFMAAAIIFTTAAVAVVIINEQSSLKYSLGEEAYLVAEGGAENAALRLLRDPSYAGETLVIGNGIAVVTATGSATKTVTSDGTADGFHRRVQVVGSYVNSVFTVNTWNEIN